MNEIQIDFLAGTGIASWLIEQVGFPRGYSHVASVLADGRYLDARSDVLGDVPAGVHIREPSTERWVRKRRVSLQVTAHEYGAWENNLRAHLTVDYDKMAILQWLEGRSLHTAGRWICSALAINAVQHIRKVRYPLVVPAHEISPDSALLILDTAGFDIGVEINA